MRGVAFGLMPVVGAVVGVLLGVVLGGCGDKIDAIQIDSDAGCPQSGAVSYQANIRALLEQHCTACHSSTKVGADRKGAPAAVNFDTFAGITASLARANAQIQARTMPPPGRPRVPNCDQALFQAWVDQGARER